MGEWVGGEWVSVVFCLFGIGYVVFIFIHQYKVQTYKTNKRCHICEGDIQCVLHVSLDDSGALAHPRPQTDSYKLNWRLDTTKRPAIFNLSSSTCFASCFQLFPLGDACSGCR